MPASMGCFVGVGGYIRCFKVSFEPGSVVGSWRFAKQITQDPVASMRYNQPGMSIKPPETRDAIWPFDDEIKASGWLRARDYGHASLIRGRVRVRTPFWIISVPLLVIVEILGIVLFVDDISWQGIILPALPLIAIYFAFIHPYVSSWYLIRKHQASGMSCGTWTFSREGIRYKSDEYDTLMKWSLVKQAIITERYVLILLDRTNSHLFASPMFDSPTDWHNFRTAIIRNFIGCRGCKYDLHGTTSDTCPECGKPIDHLA